MEAAQLVIQSDLSPGQSLLDFRAEARQSERKARTRLAALHKARKVRARNLERREAENTRAWKTWSAWCDEHAQAWHELKAAEQSDTPAREADARRRLRRVTARMPAMPTGAKP